MALAIIVHGGADTLPPEKVEASKAGCLAAVRAGWKVLEAGGSALDSVEAAVRVFEDDPTFNAGVGACLNRDGAVELDAGIMESSGLRAGGVGAIRGVRHPISVARQVLRSGSVLLVGPGAERFAAEHRAEQCDPADLVTEEARRDLEEQRHSCDTVGCVALDAQGVLAAGASTGGLIGKEPGRVGDSPLVGSGIYAEERHGACAMTGTGETIIQVALARTVIEFLAEGCDPTASAERAIRVLEERVQGEGGCIVLDPDGRIGWAHNSPDMSCAYMTSEMNVPMVFARKQRLDE
jgi:beta-aspartyl-peptidase (threonine type)